MQNLPRYYIATYPMAARYYALTPTTKKLVRARARAMARFAARVYRLNHAANLRRVTLAHGMRAKYRANFAYGLRIFTAKACGQYLPAPYGTV